MAFNKLEENQIHNEYTYKYFINYNFVDGKFMKFEILTKQTTFGNFNQIISISYVDFT